VSAGLRDQAASVTYCNGLVLDSKSDWRLPTRIELMSIVDYTRFNPTIDGSAFPLTPGAVFWSSSSYAGAAGAGWLVNFNVGNVINFGVGSSVRARCVR